VRQYTADLPKRREKLMAGVQEIRKEQAKLQAEIKQQQLLRTQQKQEYDQITVQLTATMTVLNAPQSLIRTNTDPTGTNALGLNGLPVTSTAARVYAERLQVLQTSMQQIDFAVNLNAERLQKLENDAQSQMKRVEAALSMPPIPFDPAQERERLLAGLTQRVEPKTAAIAGKGKKPVEPDEPKAKAKPAKTAASDDRRANSMLAFANTLRDTNRAQEAAEYYRRVIDSYPMSKAAQEAAKQLQRLTSFDAPAAPKGSAADPAKAP
jgi:hypothetical protein